MKRTRKWPVLKAEAKRLAAMRLSPREIAVRLGLAKSTVTRWMADGRLERKTAGPAAVKRFVTASLAQTPADWAAAVRRGHDLDATGAQLVTLAEAAMTMAQDPTVKPQLRLAATARFQSLVAQLGLVERDTDAQPAPVEKQRNTNPPIRRVAGDPRAFLEQLT